MASTQVSFLDLLPAGPITGTEVVAIVQNGWSVKTTTAALAGSPVQTQSFLTVNNEPSLNNSRQLAVGAGMSLADGGIQAALQINLTGALTNLNGLGTGIMVKTGVSTMAPRVFTTSGNGLSVANGDGIAGNPTLQLTGLPAALASSSGTGMLAIVGGTTIANRTLTGTTDQIVVTDGNGANNPAISLSSNPIIPGLAGLTLPVGATADRSVSAGVGTIRYNTSANSFEGYTATGWGFIVAGAAVTSFSAGTTGLTPGTASTGAIVLGGILNVVNGGSGTATPALVAGSNVTITGTWPNQTINSSNPGGTVTSVTGTAPVVSSGGATPAISMAAATTSVDGYLTSTDWNTFNGKQPAGAYLTSVTADAPLTGAGTSASHLSIPAATTSVNGYLTSTDWNTFNGKQPAGTYVNSVSGTTGRITSTGGVTPVIDLASGIATAGTTGSATLIPVVTIDTYGRVTGITTAANPQGTVTSVTGTAPVVSSGGATPAISMAAATTSVNGYLTSTDWTTFNNKGSGSVTSVSFTGGIITVATATTTPALTVAGTSGGLVYFSSASTWASSAALTQYGVVYGGGAGATPVATAAGTTGQVLTATTSGAPTWANPATSGTVTSVAQSFTGGLISVAGSPITSSGTLALTVAGTSGGVPYFSSATTWATSAALAANAIVVGGGAAVAPSTITTGTGVVTALGVAVGTAGAFVVNGGALGAPSSGTVTNLTGTASININGTVGATTANTGAFTTVSATGAITSTLATGTAPFTVASTTQVANLNAATAGTATNATNTGITAASTGATNYLTFVTATSGNLPQLVNSAITCNAVNGTITGGIAGGTF